ncbi:MAG: formate/nitrite transporter family protein [Planctomycetota bacterium]
MKIEPDAGIDALLPSEMAVRAEAVGVKKASMNGVSLLTLAVLAGAFISMGAVFSTTAMASKEVPWGWNRVLGGVVFSTGLILVVVGGAELFTGNTVMVMAWANRKISTAALLRNWTIVYVGNLIGALGSAGLVFLAGHHTLDHGAVGDLARRIAHAKCHAGFGELLARGVLGNAMVCLAVWLTFSARSPAARMLLIIPPITLFVAAGFEHSVANMYFIPSGYLIQESLAPDFPGVTIAGFGKNLLAVTLGNCLGGGVLVWAVYGFIYLRPRRGHPAT